MFPLIFTAARFLVRRRASLDDAHAPKGSYIGGSVVAFIHAIAVGGSSALSSVILCLLGAPALRLFAWDAVLL